MKHEKNVNESRSVSENETYLNDGLNVKEIKVNSFGKNLPEKRFSTGAITATVWHNESKGKNGEDTEYQTVTLQRSYKDKDGKWQVTTNLRVNDLPKASLVLQKAYEYIVMKTEAVQE